MKTYGVTCIACTMASATQFPMSWNGASKQIVTEGQDDRRHDDRRHDEARKQGAAVKAIVPCMAIAAAAPAPPPIATASIETLKDRRSNSTHAGSPR